MPQELEPGLQFPFQNIKLTQDTSNSASTPFEELREDLSPWHGWWLGDLENSGRRSSSKRGKHANINGLEFLYTELEGLLRRLRLQR